MHLHHFRSLRQSIEYLQLQQLIKLSSFLVVKFVNLLHFVIRNLNHALLILFFEVLYQKFDLNFDFKITLKSFFLQLRLFIHDLYHCFVKLMNLDQLADFNNFDFSHFYFNWLLRYCLFTFKDHFKMPFHSIRLYSKNLNF